ncbi:uncharacterized protein EI90DRAFT_2644844 [Cantharellus anzutake]|uniref:uncharacterized protein n=1 Tax=Cantharellus anzutake TaxID=1750568 RepID=UPI0019050090|nr:uncharacterized protein EI90DRAFT_2644844 [Cantharellus anzutake]KAF8337382.1 hypothetical protein EI90DRAFT_2644844 [Cantharellus anzutake]
MQSSRSQEGLSSSKRHLWFNRASLSTRYLKYCSTHYPEFNPDYLHEQPNQPKRPALLQLPQCPPLTHTPFSHSHHSNVRLNDICTYSRKPFHLHRDATPIAQSHFHSISQHYLDLWTGEMFGQGDVDEAASDSLSAELTIHKQDWGLNRTFRT